MARELGDISEEFDPAIWLEDNRAELTVLATEAVKEVIYEALAGGSGTIH